MSRANWHGIDAPFGWSDAMVDAVHCFAQTGVWPGAATPKALRYRTTDWFAHEIIAEKAAKSVWPLWCPRTASPSARGAARGC